MALPGSLALSPAAGAQPVVQPLPAPEALRLNAALTRLAANPRDVAALIDAGEAAKALGDFEAAEGFFRRASQMEPGNGRAKAGLACALALGGDPYSAIPLFEEAAKAGSDLPAIAPERGLAYDLVGANVLAQQYYRQALPGDANGEVRRRLALSLAISGDGAAAEEMLLPLLREQDTAAWRTRVFALAILGRTKEAVDVTNALLPANFAQNIIPYLRYMPQLTPAQQAAAANLGKFPRASEIGRDDPRIAAYASLATPRPKVAAVDAALVPQGEPLGKSRKRSGRRASSDSQIQDDSSQNSRRRAERSGKPSKEAPESIAQAQEPRVMPPEPKPAKEVTLVSQPTLALATQPRPAPPPPPVPAPAPVAPGFDLARLPNSAVAGPAAQSPATPPPAAAEPSQPDPPPQAGFAEVFGDLGKPAPVAPPAAGAVDIRKIEPPRAKPEPPKKPPKPAPPSHPSRIWVQLGVGQNVAALKYDWRKLLRQQAALFKGRKAYVSDLGRTNRMLTGPFESRKAADDFLAQLAKAGFDGPYLWISPAGQVVDQLSD